MAPRPRCPRKPPALQDEEFLLACRPPASKASLHCGVQLRGFGEKQHQEEPVDLGDEQERDLLSGVLLKFSSLPISFGTSALAEGLPSLIAGPLVRPFLWRKRFVKLTTHRILYGPLPSGAGSAGESAPHPSPDGEFLVTEVSFVKIFGSQVVVHFSSAQSTGRRNREKNTLCLLGKSDKDAAQWGEALRSAVGARLHRLVPRGWNLSAMLNGSGSAVRRVHKVQLSEDMVQMIQHVVDHAFICKRTRDRRNQELPVRLQVEKVMSVHNISAWLQYAEARARIRSVLVASEGALPAGDGASNSSSSGHSGSFPNPSPDAAGAAYSSGGCNSGCLEPEVLTSSSGMSDSLGLLDKAANEQWLFHGTKADSAQDITDGVFRVDLAGSHRGTLYGKAIYLAECSSKADEYSEADEDGLCRMLLCRATLGNILVERERKPSAPELEELCRSYYHSVCGDRWAAVGTFREFVLYESSQVYPEYIVYYRHIHQTDFLQAIGSISKTGDDLEGVRKLVPHAARLAQCHPDPQVKYRISLSLGAHASTVVPALMDCLDGHEAPMRRRTAAVALGLVAGSCLPRLGFLSGFSSQEDSQPEDPAALVATAVPSLVACLSDENPGVRRAAAQALGLMEIIGAPAIPVLVQALRDPVEEVRCEAATALQKMGGVVAAVAIPALAALALRESCGSKSQQVAVQALGEMGAAAGPAVPVLVRSLQNSSPAVRRAAATSLEKLGSVSVTGIPSLLVVITDKDPDVRQQTCKALGALGPFVRSPLFAAAANGGRESTSGGSGQETMSTARCIAQALTERLNDSNSKVRAAAAVATGQLCISTTVPLLCDRLREDPNADVRKAAAQALGKMNQVASAAVPYLMKALKDGNESVRLAAVMSLGHFDADTSGNLAMRALTGCLSDTTASIRKAAARSLGQVGNPTKGTIAGLTLRLKDPDEAVREAAQNSLDILAQKRASAEEASEGTPTRSA